jgi:hypothetical protein
MADSNIPNKNDIEQLSDLARSLSLELLRGKTIMSSMYSITKEFGAEIELIRERITSQKNAMADMIELVSKQGSQYLKQETLIAKIEQSKARARTIQEDILSFQQKEQEIAQKMANTAGVVSGRKKKDLQNEITANNDISAQIKAQLADLQKQAQAEEFIRENTQKILDNSSKSNEQYFRSIASGNALKKIFNSIANIPILGSLINFNAISEKMDATLKETKSEWKSLATGVEAFAAEVVTLVTSPLGMIVGMALIIKSLITASLELDKTITKISNNIGLSRKGAQGLFDSFAQTSIEGSKLVSSLDQAFLSVTNQADALAGLQESFGTSAMFSDEMLQNQILLTKQMGLEADEAAGLQKLGMLNKQSVESILNTTLKNNTANISNRKIISEIAKINAEISAAYKNNPDLIAKAVVQAAKLGMTMEQSRKVADSLLDFESSISNELEAELLTGKQLNFEKARALALDGKSSEAAAELMSQMGGMEALTKMNVITRNAMAKSIGMTSEELMKSVQQQEILNALGADNQKQVQDRYDKLISMNKTAEAAALLEDIRKQKNGELMAQDISRANLSQRFEETMNRIKEIFVTIASGPILDMLDSFAKWIGNGDKIKEVFSAIRSQMKLIEIIAVGIMTAINPLAGIAYVAGRVGIAAMSSPDTVSDSQINPSGQIMIKTPKGMIKPDPKDSIITTTDPDKLLGKTDKTSELNTLPTAKSVATSPVASPSSPESNISKIERPGIIKPTETNTEKTVSNNATANNKGTDNTGIELRLDKMLSALNKGGHVYIDSVRSGTAYGMSYNSYA